MLRSFTTKNNVTNANMTTTTTVIPPTRHRDDSRIWLFMFILLTVIFLVVGGALFGQWYRNHIYCGDYTSCMFSNLSLRNGAIACLTVAAICKLAFWITLIIRCARRNRTIIVYTNAPAPAPTPAPEAGMDLPPYSYPTADKAAEMTPMRICGQCGRATNTPFCGYCGSPAPSPT